MKSYLTPTDDEVNRTLPLLSSPQHEAYFFDRLENPLWITPLANRGVFKAPPSAEPLKDGGVRFPSWAPSRYLSRMASQAPTVVASLYAAMETDNSSVIADIVNAAVAMPPRDAATLVPTISKAAQCGLLRFRFHDANDLCLKLAEGKEAAAALELSEAVYSPHHLKHSESLRHNSVFRYSKGLDTLVPALTEAAPRRFLAILRDWLTYVVQQTKSVDSSSRSDYSFIWRPAIEDHEQNSDYDLAGVLVGIVRNAFELAIRSEAIRFDDALALLSEGTLPIFKRIVIHLTNAFAESNRELAIQTLLTRDLIDDSYCKHEYAMLVRKRFGLLTAHQQDQWLQWVDELHLAYLNGEDTSRSTSERSPDLLKKQADYWKFATLDWVHAHLDGERLSFYERSLTEHGRPQLSDLNVYSTTGFRGEESPISLEALASRTFHEVLEIISAWRPPSPSLTGPSVEGLNATFEQFVASDPVKFSADARALIGRSTIFVSGFLGEMAKAAQAGRHIDIHAVLDLCDWIVTSPTRDDWSEPGPTRAPADPPRQWARDEVTRFLDAACESQFPNSSDESFEEVRKRVWRLLAALCQDSPTSYIVYDRDSVDPRSQDFLDFAINSPRGKAVEAALRYADYVEKHLRRSLDLKSTDQATFDLLPEVREMLNWQMSLKNRSFEGLAVIGSRMALLYTLDRKWLADNAENLFMLGEVESAPKAAYGWAAWNSFLIWVRPHIEFYRLFESQFEFAIENSGKTTTDSQTRHQPMNHLGEHLVSLYGRGQLDLKSGSALRRFLECASPEFRRHAISFVGMSLGRSENTPAEVISRFQDLWDAYWAEFGADDIREARDSYLFGPWFCCEEFPEEWALDRLHEFVKICPTPEPDNEVIARLVKAARKDVVQAVKILDIVVRNDVDGWRIDGWREEARQILVLALLSSSEARNTAVELINFLGRRGRLEFGKLLHGME